MAVGVMVGLRAPVRLPYVHGVEPRPKADVERAAAAAAAAANPSSGRACRCPGEAESSQVIAGGEDSQ